MIETPISEDDDGIRLDRWFKRHYPAVAHSMLQKMMRKGQVRLDGKKTDTSVRVSTGQEVRFPSSLTEMVSSKPQPTVQSGPSAKDREEMRAMVMYDEGGVMVLNKPAGLAVQGGSGITRSVDGMLDALADKAGNRPKLVHRLDKDTSGVLVLARTAKMAAQLTEAFRGQDAEKTYWALVVGVPARKKGEIKLSIGKHMLGDKEKMDVREDGKRAVTRYQILDQAGKRVALVALYPLTGRTHQLRVHMQAIGHPILGDGKYGGADAFIDGLGIAKQLHLHARHIRLSLPGGRVIEHTAPVPRHLQHALTELGLVGYEQ